MMTLLDRPATVFLPLAVSPCERGDHDWWTRADGWTVCRNCPAVSTGYRAAFAELAELAVLAPVMGGDHDRCPVCNGSGTRKVPDGRGGTVEVPCPR